MTIQGEGGVGKGRKHSRKGKEKFKEPPEDSVVKNPPAKQETEI